MLQSELNGMGEYFTIIGFTYTKPHPNTEFFIYVHFLIYFIAALTIYSKTNTSKRVYIEEICISA